MRRTSEYRRYNKSLPAWLHNKPKGFTKHCVEKLNLAKDIHVTDIIAINPSNREFIVKSQTSERKYTVTFGNETDVPPSCQCVNWKKVLLPCKHMLAVFEHHKDFGWDSLPVAYTSSPYFNLDYDVINSIPSAVSASEEEYYNIVEDEVIMATIPKKVYPKRTKASSCRELLNQIKSMTYLVNEVEVLHSLEDQLKSSLKMLSDLAPQDDGVVTEPLRVKRRINKSNIKVDLPNLPKPKSLKSSLTGRVGIAAEKRKIAASVSVNDIKKEDKNAVLEEIAPDDEAHFDIPLNCESCFGDIPLKVDTKNLIEGIASQDGPIFDVHSKKPLTPVQNKDQGSNKSGKRKQQTELQEIIVTGTVKPHGKVKKKKKVKLFRRGKAIYCQRRDANG